ncbi:MAG TPA: ABC transporter permease [Gemmatimonadaceae bacterium]|jgi:predicted permease|nr:ABC transporter permease [Gemmatimonadaceae bacterium]
MSLIDSLRYRLGALLHPRRHARELREELDFHLSLAAMQREHAARGTVSREEAYHAARRRLGNMTSVEEEARQMAGLGFFDVAVQDARFALRSFRRSPAFTAVAVLTLAIGIGANTAIFSAVDALLLRPLPFADPDRLMQVSLTLPAFGASPARDDMVWSIPKARVFRDAQKVFSSVSLYTDYQFTVRDVGAERADGEYADSRYLPTLGIQPIIGRNFTADEDEQLGAARVVMLGDAFWQRRFNADPSVLGRTLNLEGEPYTIIGVLPPGFRGLTGRAELLVPLASLPVDASREAWSHSFSMVARLAPGVSAERAKQEVASVGRQVDESYPARMQGGGHWGATARLLDATRVNPVVRRSLLVLFGAVGLVLLIACANVANLFLVRAVGRSREIAVRLAVGAGRRRVVRQLLTESVLLSGAGGMASVLVAWWGVKLLSAVDPSTTLGVQRLAGLGAVSFDSIRLDATAFIFTALLALATGIIFGLVPALQATRPSLTDTLKADSSRSRQRGVRGLASRNVLAAAEIALALVLLAGSGLMLRSLGKLLGVQPGFDSEHVLTLRLNTGETFGRDSLPGFYDLMLQRLGAIPGVTGVALGDCPPLNGGCNGTVLLRRDRPAVDPGSAPEVGVHWVTPGWLSTLRVPLVRGRMFGDGDRLGGRKVVLVSESAARRYFPGEDPIGRPVSVGQGGFWDDTAYVAGVVGDVRYGTIDSLPKPDVYLSYYQSPRGRMMVYLRTAGDPLAITPAVRRVLREVAPDAPVYDVRTLSSRVADASAYARFSAMLLAIFAGMALVLAAIGVYGVISFAAGQRTKEIGLRVALGASPGSVVRLVVRQGLAIALVGLVAGVTGALLATRLLKSMLYDVAPSDPLTFVGIVAVLVATVLLASWIPARRAAGVQPMEALREG